MLHDLLLVAAGLVLLFVGGEGLVRGSVAIAERLGISKLLIGLVIVGFGTSTPELLFSVNAALDGAPEIALGNVVGSNIANVLLVIGVAAVIAPIMGWERTAVRRLPWTDKSLTHLTQPQSENGFPSHKNSYGKISLLDGIR